MNRTSCAEGQLEPNTVRNTWAVQATRCATHTAAKIVFYAAQVRHASAPVLHAVAADVEHWAAKLKTEDEGGQNGEQEEAFFF